MTNAEMQKAVNFMVETQAQTAVKLERLSNKVDAIPVAQNRSEKRWKRTEKSIRALLARAKIQNEE
jgi:hypothetical protein